jgi:hypothetical protein
MRGIAVSGMALVGLFAVGCADTKKMMDDMMKMPERPAALNELDAFVGTWEISGEWVANEGKDNEAKMVKSGKMTCKWNDESKWWLECESEITMKMDGKESKKTEMKLCTWCPKQEDYVAFSTNSKGMPMTCTGTLKDGVWTVNSDMGTFELTMSADKKTINMKMKQSMLGPDVRAAGTMTKK